MSTARRVTSPARRAGFRRVLAASLVALLAALTPLLSAAPAGAARTSGRAVSATASAAPSHGTSTGRQSRGGLRPVGHRSPGTAGRRVADKAGALRQAHPQRGGTVHQPTGPASSSIDATGPPSFLVTTVSSSQQRLGGCDYPAAAGRAPPSSCGS